MFNIDNEVLKIYRDYTYARSEIYYKKEELKLPPPWTDHAQLLIYKFTCHRRELDRESKFLIKTVCENPSLSLDNKILNCALFRMFNHSDGTKYLLKWPVDFETLDINEYYKYDIEHHKNFWNMYRLQSNAYFLSSSKKAANTISKPEYKGLQTNLINLILKHKQDILDAAYKKTAKEVIIGLSEVNSFGDFLTYQVWVDFTYIPGYPQTENDIVISGPGCDNGIDWMVGINYIDINNIKTIEYGSFTKKYPDKSYNDFIYWFHDNLPKLMSENNFDWDPAVFQHYLPVKQQNWGLMQIENSFCELNKLMKLRNNISMRKRYY